MTALPTIERGTPTRRVYPHELRRGHQILIRWAPVTQKYEPAYKKTGSLLGRIQGVVSHLTLAPHAERRHRVYQVRLVTGEYVEMHASGKVDIVADGT